MWVLVWVITSMMYGPTRSVGTAVFHSQEACLSAGNFLKQYAVQNQTEKLGASVEVSCVEDK